MKRAVLMLIFSLLLSRTVYTQELNVRVQVAAPTVSNISKENVEEIQSVIRNFLTNNKWTNQTYLPQERIECMFVVIITAWDGGSSYKAEAQIQTSRPVFGSAYTTTLLNLTDKDFDFNYTSGQPLDFSEQNYLNNLSSLLSFYAYTIIGLDKDSFSKLAGTPYYLKAQTILNLAQVSGNLGWKAFDGLRNRYWINENLLNQSFQELRVFLYNYHLNTLDKIHEDPFKAAAIVLGFLRDLKQMDKQKLGSIFPNLYFATKADEIVNILSIGTPQNKMEGYNLLNSIDPANLNKYGSLSNSK